ncbi:hypothetical protein AWM79_01170 [Pseudomonas agarici]|uniref:Uncharacterized protein n=1 Tax=Pseudomonas agarici TaxID=46677 RepID=A0A0X1SVP0_PSEAA|nr:hypothetical protein [Pseudomonas agarici]AMB83992.1 hypothetical protein AWM79_01170 [Pseudomonas agarici]NWB91480.1 hypothetical protein [Pseudomonas agarici]NWC07772.1 hypothetical protein [Pseudomonas agarici]SEK73986.1 hypothetical protein SAMN05216604_10640 [Pseudomonas agarici]
MIVLMDFRRFLVFYFPVFIGVFLAAIASVLFSISLITDNFYQEDTGVYILLIESLFALIIVHSHFMVLRGRPQWVWGIVGVLVICLLSPLSAAHYMADQLTWFLAVLFPLLGLFVLNSKRHRKMRCKMAQVRRHREVVIKALKGRQKFSPH